MTKINIINETLKRVENLYTSWFHSEITFLFLKNKLRSFKLGVILIFSHNLLFIK